MNSLNNKTLGVVVAVVFLVVVGIGGVVIWMLGMGDWILEYYGLKI